MRHGARLLLPALVLILSGCASLRSGDGSSPVLGWKVVMQKSEPTYLLAGDGTECTVPQDRYDRTHVGDRVFCAWRRSGGMSGSAGGGLPLRAASPIGQ